MMLPRKSPQGVIHHHKVIPDGFRPPKSPQNFPRRPIYLDEGILIPQGGNQVAIGC
jgi:hypothetical protein